MKNVRSMILVAFAIVILGTVVYRTIPRRQAVQETTSRSTTADRTTRSSRPKSTMRSVEPPAARSPMRLQPSSEESPAPSAGKSQPEAARPEAQAQGNEQKPAPAGSMTPKTTQMRQVAPVAQEAIQDPMARVALAFVGADPDAEMYWYGAINDPSLSAHERQDLIEDLNEDGLSDPQNPTMEDLPLILSRIGLIEAVVWDAMDEVNADAFQEAYKDLVNLAIQAMGNG
ncbi:MAG: hypothetical protein NTZ17_20070 [Phycisphaerae bacterium]|nr:hypothetical protein [Phycisphaerae bacterium]